MSTEKKGIRMLQSVVQVFDVMPRPVRNAEQAW